MLALGPRHDRLKLGNGQPHRHDLRGLRTSCRTTHSSLESLNFVACLGFLNPLIDLGL